MSAPRICARCHAEVPGFQSYQKGWKCEDCTTFLSKLTRSTGKEQIEEARSIIEHDMDDMYQRVVEDLLDSEEALWILDPQVDYVVALVDRANPRKAWIVVYLIDADWEVNDERFEARLAY